MSSDPNEKKSQSVRRGLIILLIGLQLATVCLILFVTHFSVSRDINKQVSSLLQSALNESKEHTQGFLESAYRSVQLSTSLLSNGNLTVLDHDSLEAYFLSQLQTHPEMTGIYVATPNSDFYFVTRDGDRESPRYLTKIIDGNAPGKASFFVRDAKLDLVQSRIDVDDDFKVRKRPWYLQAVDQESLVWTEPYIFFTSKLPGITVASPFYNESGELQGVLGVDIELTQLSEFLANLKVYGSVSVFMASKSGNFVATPSLATNAFAFDTLNVMGSSQEMTVEKQAVGHFLQQNKVTEESLPLSHFDFGGDRYVTRYESFLLKDGPEWIMGAYALESDFLTDIRQGELRNTIFALIILALSLLVGWVLIKKTWRPFERFFHDVITDQLTGLFNRRFLENIGSRMYIRLLRDRHDVISIAVIDLDLFKKVNIEFGSAVGNQVLVAFADFMRKTLRPEDIITRYSGDTFVVIFPGMDHEQAIKVVERMRKHLDAWPLPVNDLLIRLSFSAGVETIDNTNSVEDAAFSDFIEVAKRALRDGKTQGRGMVVSANQRNYQIEK